MVKYRRSGRRRLSFTSNTLGAQVVLSLWLTVLLHAFQPSEREHRKWIVTKTGAETRAMEARGASD